MLEALERKKERALIDLKEEVCEIKRSGHLFIGGSPTGISKKGARNCFKIINKRKGHALSNKDLV